MIAVVNYGLGNIQAFLNIYRRLGIDARAVTSPNELRNASKIILPGVGSFDWAMQQLERSGLMSVLNEEVLTNKKPVLGVCVGMQIMARSSEEGISRGLGWIDATVSKFDFQTHGSDLPLPHMGWNDVQAERISPLFEGIDRSRYYFLHSYHIHCFNSTDILSTTSYGLAFASAVSSENVYGTQFHPEKSHGSGVQLLKNFAELI